MIKAFKYRLYPNEKQQEMLEKHFGTSRWVYNWGLEMKMKHYKETGKSLSVYEMMPKLVMLKKEELTKWLAEVNSQSIQQSLWNLETAYTNFFKKKADFPKFKSKRDSKKSFQCPQLVRVNAETGMLKIPKIKDIPIILHRSLPEGKMGTCTVSQNVQGQCFISIPIETGIEMPKKSEVRREAILGIDVGIKSYLTDSNGRKFDNPKWLRQSEQRLKHEQRQFSRKKKGSANRKEQQTKLSMLHLRVSNQRRDFLHKLTYQLTHESQVNSIGIEDLNVAGMVKNHKLAKSISDAGWSTFFQYLSYKCDWYGKNLLQIGRFTPSTKVCNDCGMIKRGLTLKDRTWLCECGVFHDRDINAAKNIRDMAYFSHLRARGTGGEPKQSLLEPCGNKHERRKKEAHEFIRGQFTATSLWRNEGRCCSTMVSQ